MRASVDAAALLLLAAKEPATNGRRERSEKMVGRCLSHAGNGNAREVGHIPARTMPKPLSVASEPTTPAIAPSTEPHRKSVLPYRPR